MNKSEIMNKASLVIGKASLTLKKHSPEILVVSGIVGAVVRFVLKPPLEGRKPVEDRQEG